MPREHAQYRAIPRAAKRHFSAALGLGFNPSPDDGKMTKNRDLRVFPWQMRVPARPGISVGKVIEMAVGSR
jgi:hypothetical protein